MALHTVSLTMSWKRRGSDRNLKWVAASNGDVPANAVEVGRLGGRGGEFIYIGRVVLSSDDIVPGTVIPSKNACYIVWDGKAIESENYEVLINTQPDLCHLHWSHLTSDGCIPNDAIKGGFDKDADELVYICRARPPGVIGTHVGTIRSGESEAVIGYNGVVHKIHDFRILCRKLLAHHQRPFTS